MSPRARPANWGGAALILGAVSGVAWIVLAARAPAPAFQGWWTSFTFTSGPAIGSLVWLVIRRLVGGGWGEAFAPEFEPAARAVALVSLFALPVVAAPAWVFGWAQAPRALDPEVARFYLNPIAFAARQIVFLGGLSLIAWRLPWIDGPKGRLAAGLALVFYGVGATLAAVDWTLSLQPSFTNSAAGMDLACTQLASGLAWAGLRGGGRASSAAAGDLGALLFSTLLGLSYLTFVEYLVVWYGDRPVQSIWYLVRLRGGWGWAPPAAFVTGFVAPTTLLALRRAIGGRKALAGAGLFALCGLAILTLWEHAPAFGAAARLPTGLAALAQGGLLIGAVEGSWRLRARPRREPVTHGV